MQIAHTQEQEFVGEIKKENKLVDLFLFFCFHGYREKTRAHNSENGWYSINGSKEKEGNTRIRSARDGSREAETPSHIPYLVYVPRSLSLSHPFHAFLMCSKCCRPVRASSNVAVDGKN